MSLQTYDITIGVNKSQKVAAQGRYIYYLKGTTPLITAGNTPSAAYNHEIKATTGSTSIVLRPGQSYRIPDDEKSPSEWVLTNSLNAETITGTVFVGEGDFNDNNTNQTNFLKLDATFANNVKVTNTTAERVPVSLDVAQTLPVRVTNTTAQRVPVTLDPAQVLNTSEGTVAYTKAWSNTATMQGGLRTIMTPAENPNGAILNVYRSEGYASSSYGMAALIAKTSAPANVNDGDVLLQHVYMTTHSVRENVKQILIPAGKGLYLFSGVAETQVFQHALLTVL